MKTLPALIIGSSFEAKRAADILSQLDTVIYGFLYETEESDLDQIFEIPVLGSILDKTYQNILASEKVDFVIAVSDLDLRKSLLKSLFALCQRLPLNVCHPSSVLSVYGTMGGGNIIEPYVTVANDTSIGALNYFGAGTSIDAEVTIGSFNQIAAGVKFGRGCKLDDETYIGAGSIICPNVRIGQRCLIAPGSVVMKDVEDEDKVAGNPAKLLS